MFGFSFACFHPLIALFINFAAAAMPDQSKFGFWGCALESHYSKLMSVRALVCVLLHTNKCYRIHLGSRAALRYGLIALKSQAPGFRRFFESVLS